MTKYIRIPILGLQELVSWNYSKPRASNRLILPVTTPNFYQMIENCTQQVPGRFSDLI